MHTFVQARVQTRAMACAFLLIASACPVVRAATPAAEFPVSPAQMQSLGVTLQKLDKPTAIRGMSFPAKVTVPPGQDLVVSAPVDGVVDKLFVTGQEPVNAGQPLLRLVSPGYGDLQLRLMEAAGKARLSQKALAREQQLFSEGIIPERRVLEAEVAERTDSAKVRQAEAELRLAGADPAIIRRAAEGGRLDEGLVVRAQSAGQVLGIEAKPGQRVKQADTLVRLANLSQLWLEVQVPGGHSVPPKAELGIIGRDATALVQSVGATVGEGQTVTLRARVTKGAAQLRPGEIVQAQVPFAASQGWVLPLAAVTRDQDKAYVFVRSAKGFVATPVTVLSSAEQSVQVSADLRPSQEVATTSVIALKAAWLGKGGSN